MSPNCVLQVDSNNFLQFFCNVHTRQAGKNSKSDQDYYYSIVNKLFPVVVSFISSFLASRCLFSLKNGFTYQLTICIVVEQSEENKTVVSMQAISIDRPVFLVWFSHMRSTLDFAFGHQCNNVSD